MLQILIATQLEKNEILKFFEKHLNNNQNITNQEHLCPLGIKSAINRKQILIAKKNGKIIAALRFYPRKKENATSLYQFAINEKHRKQNLLKQMLQTLNTKKIITSYPKNHNFNNYFKKTKWELEEKQNHNNWILKIKQK